MNHTFFTKTGWAWHVTIHTNGQITSCRVYISRALVLALLLPHWQGTFKCQVENFKYEIFHCITLQSTTDFIPERGRGHLPVSLPSPGWKYIQWHIQTWPKVQRWFGKGLFLSLGMQREDWSPNSQANIPKRRTFIQVLPPANLYTKSAHAYIHFAKSFCYLLLHLCILPGIAIRHSMRILDTKFGTSFF